MCARTVGGGRVVVTDYDYPSLDLERDLIESAGFDFVAQQLREEQDIIAACGEADVLLNQYARLTAGVFAALPRLRGVVRYGVGVDNIDIEAATRHGVVVCNVPDYGVEEVSDHALTLLLVLIRRVVLLDRLVHRGVWDVTLAGPVARLRGRTLGIVGLGRIGSALAQKAGALGMHVLAHDPYCPPARFAELGAAQRDLPGLLADADAVSLHVALSAETRHLIGRDELARMRPDAVLVNTSRGPVVDEQALVEALQAGRLAGVALDVLEREPIDATHPLLGFERVVLTPHAAWYSAESAVLLKRLAAEEAVRLLRGEPARCPINPEAAAPRGPR